MGDNKSSKKKTLAKNTFFLYAMSLSSQVISLFTVPYQTRILSPELYGTVGFAVSLMLMASLVLNFGFLYSATQRVAENTDDLDYVSKIYTSVFIIKVCLGAIVLVVVLGICSISEAARSNPILFLLYYFAYFLAALLPDFLYRGFERMKVVTIRTVSIRLFAAVSIFVFLKSEQDVLVIPGALLIGNAVALLVCLLTDKRSFGVSFCRVRSSFVWRVFADSIPFFASRAASTVYQSANAVILGLFYPGQAVVGWFNAADKGLSAVKMASSPIADSIYPYMVKNKDFALAKKVLLASVPIIVLACVIAFMFADQLCGIVFGEGYEQAGDVLRCLIPAMAVIFPTYIVCFPIMVPMGLAKQANMSTVFGMCLQLALLAALVVSGTLNVYSLCICASVSEVSVFLFRITNVIVHRDRITMKCMGKDCDED